MVVWISPDWNQKTLEISTNAKSVSDVEVISSLWLHPYEAVSGQTSKENYRQQLAEMVELYKKHSDVVKAIGECWTDNHYDDGLTLWFQKELFGSQCDIAVQLDLPVMIHSRDDFEWTFDVLQNYKNHPVYFHCWTYNAEQIRKLQNHFTKLWIGFTWVTMYPKSAEIRESLKILNPESLLIETDSPYLPPQTKRGQVNIPANIPEIYQYVADQLNITLPQLQLLISQNYNKLYFSEMSS